MLTLDLKLIKESKGRVHVRRKIHENSHKWIIEEKRKLHKKYPGYQIATIHQVIITNAPRGKTAISRISRRVVINQDFLLLC